MADTARLRALQNLSTALPVANQKVAAGQQAARDMQLQAAVKAAPAQTNIPQAAAQTGQAAAEQAGTQAVQAAQTNQQQQNQVAQIGQQQQATANQQQIASLAQGSKEQQMDSVQKLAQLDAKLKADIYDRNMKFERDELGRTQLNETQMADYLRMKAGSDEQFRNYAQTAQQASTRNLQMMETAYKKVIEDLSSRYEQARQSGDQETMRDITNMKYETDARMERERARAANSAAAWGAAGTIIGTAVGGSMGGSQGAKIGASVGGSAGSLGNALGGGNPFG